MSSIKFLKIASERISDFNYNLTDFSVSVKAYLNSEKGVY